MTEANAASDPPVAQTAYLDRLAALFPTLEASPELWTEVHEAIQEQLAVLEADVCGKVPGIRVVAGRTRGARFFLFSYRTFSIPGCGVDPLVAGLAFTPADQGIAIEADVTGEQTGDRVSSVHCTTMVNTRVELLAAAQELARKLFESAEAIAAALNDPSRRVE